MTTLTQLIEQCCSDGMEYVKLGDVATVRNGWGFPTKYQGGSSGVPFFKVADMNHVDNQTHLQRSMNYVERSVLKSMKAGTAPAGTVVFPKIGAAVATNKKRLLVEESSYDNNVAGVIPGEGLNPLFLFYFFLDFDLCTIALQSGATPSIRKSAIERISLPLPPREVQDAIVERLDAFAKLIESLDSEIALREKRFEYFREQLLTFDESDGVEYVKLEDVAEVGTGKCDRKNATDDGEYPFFVRSEQVLRYPTYQFDEEAIIVPGEGGIGEIFHHINGKYALHQRAYRVHFIDEGVSTRYGLYAFKTFFKNYVMRRAVTATVTSLRKPMFTEFQFPLPPRETQDAIVDKLDTMQAFIDNLKHERELRRTQFEYYREKLLTFNS